LIGSGGTSIAKFVAVVMMGTVPVTERRSTTVRPEPEEQTPAFGEYPN
jgi:hypothetical protein